MVARWTKGGRGWEFKEKKEEGRQRERPSVFPKTGREEYLKRRKKKRPRGREK